MKFSKLLKMILGFAGLFNMGIVEEGGGGSSEPLNAFQAADAFSSLMGGDAPAEKEKQADESPEAAAERLAKHELSGDEEGQASGNDASDPAPDDGAVTIEIDGKPVTLTKEQIAENHKNGLRQADYTRKTMETAEVRKAAEAETAKARQERDTYAQKLNTFAIATHSQLENIASQLTEELLERDPVEYLRLDRSLKDGQAKLTQAQQELQHIGQQQQQEKADAERVHLDTQREQLLAKLPEWSDPKKAAADAEAIRAHRLQLGYPPEMNNLTHHLDVITARKAMQYDALMERAKATAKKVAATPIKAERAGSTEVSKPDGRTEAMKRLGKSGSINDARDAFAQFI